MCTYRVDKMEEIKCMRSANAKSHNKKYVN